MAIIIGSARIDENGKISGGAAGDQTGNEITTQRFYTHSKGWYILRPKSVVHANGIATAMQEACANNHIGYDQIGRYGVITYFKQYGALAKIAVNTEADCSSLVRACIWQATGKDVGDFNTANEASALESSGLFEARISCSSSADVYNGDVLVTKTKGHTVIVVSGRPRSTSSTSSSTTSDDKYYRVGTGWSNGKCVGQIGAYTSLTNAKAACKSGYTVYDPDGKAVYSAATTSAMSVKQRLIRDGQIHANNFAGCGIATDGVYGSATKKAGVKVLQQALNRDYSAGLTVDGIYGSATANALGNHYVKRGEKQYMVTALEILLMLRGYEVGGVESPGTFGSGLEKAVASYKKAKSLSSGNVADAATFKSLIS